MPARKKHHKKPARDRDEGEGSQVPRILVPESEPSSAPQSGDTSAASSALHTPLGTPMPVTEGSSALEAPPAGTGTRNLRQRFAEMTRELGKAGEELSVRLRRKVSD